MLLHMSFTAREPERVARVLAELLVGTVVAAPAPPFPAEARYVCCFDEHGTLLEVLPSGTRYRAGPNGMPHASVSGQPGDESGVHALFTTALERDAIEQIAAREGWPVSFVDAGLFKLMALWIEGTQLVELMPLAWKATYAASFGAAGRTTLDARLREVERQLRERMARRDAPH